MGFYGFEPVSKAEATYLWTGIHGPGVYLVTVQGDAPRFSYGFTLQRDPHFVGGLKVDSMGWTGPLAPGTEPYEVHGSFPGQFHKTIIVQGSNGSIVVDVHQIPHDKADDFVKGLVHGQAAA